MIPSKQARLPLNCLNPKECLKLPSNPQFPNVFESSLSQTLVGRQATWQRTFAVRGSGVGPEILLLVPKGVEAAGPRTIPRVAGFINE